MTQTEKVRFILRLSLDHGYIPIYHAGDFFHKPCVSKEFENRVIECLTTEGLNRIYKIYAIPGNHDLPGGNIKMVDRTSYQTLVNSGFIQCVSSTPYNIHIVHKYIYHKNIPVWATMENSEPALSYMKKNKQHRIIVTGDNHESFAVRSKDKKQLLINPGCICRQRLSERDYIPKVYIVDSKDLSFEEVIIPHKSAEEVISASHLKSEVEIDKRIVDFISKLNEDSLEIDFEESLRSVLSSNKINNEVKKVIMESMVG